MSEINRLSIVQKELLAEIKQAGTLYIRRFGRYGRTAEVLRRKGLIEISERDHSPEQQNGFRVVDTSLTSPEAM